MVAMPPSWASWGPLNRTGRPSKTPSPTSRSYTPVRILMRVDLPAPFCPMRACTSPRRTSKLAFRRAGTPLKALSTPVMDSRTSSPAIAPPSRLSLADGTTGCRGRRGGPAAASERSEGGVEQLGRVLGVEEAVGVDQCHRRRLAARVLLHGVEGLRPEARRALHDPLQPALLDRREPVLLAVDADELDVLARRPAGRLDRGDRADRHLVVVGVDRRRVRVRLEQRLRDRAALDAGEVTVLARDDLHAGAGLDGLVEALLAVDRGGGAGRPLELDDLGVAAGRVRHRPRRPLALLDEVGGHDRDEVLARLGDAVVDVAVDEEHRDPGRAGLLDHVAQLLGDRCDEQGVRLLRDEALDVLDLLGLVVVRVGDRQLPAALGRLLLEARRLRQPPGVFTRVLAERDVLGALLRQLRGAGRVGDA